MKNSRDVINLVVVEPVAALSSPNDWIRMRKLATWKNDTFSNDFRRTNVFDDVFGPVINACVTIL